MPRSKEGKTRPPIDIGALERAVKEVVDNNVKVRTAAKMFGISKTTLFRHLSLHRLQIENNAQANPNNADYVYQAKYDIHKVFSDNQELQLVDYYLQAARLHHGLTKKDAMKLAYEFAQENHIQIPKNWTENKTAGEMWLRGLRKRHTNLSLRKPEATSLSRATSFNRQNVSSFFNNLQDVMTRYQFPPRNIYNLDETGNSTVHTPPKILSSKGVKQVGSVTSGERGINITMIAAVNAIGNHVTPMLIFPRVHFKPHMLIGAPKGSIGGANPSGWSNEGLFVDYLKHFIAQEKPTKDHPILLILDNHESHISVPAISLAKENGIVMLTLPPHTSHKLQPLDRTVFGPYKSYYNAALNSWLLDHPGKPITLYDIAGVIGTAFSKSFTKENIEKGFQVTGIHPFNNQVFRDDEFLSSYVTDREIRNETSVGELSSTIQDNTFASPSTSNSHYSAPSTSTSTIPLTSSWKSPEAIRPFPKAAPRLSQKGRKKGKTRILTDTPEKESIENEKKCVKRKVSVKSYPTVKRKVLQKDSSSGEDNNEKVPSSSSSDEETLFENIKRRDVEEKIEENFARGNLNKGDFVLVRILGKKLAYFYVGEITNILSDSEFQVKYYKRISDTRSFILERHEEYDVPENDIIGKLPPPVIQGSLTRQTILFEVDFSSYNVR